MYKIFCQSILKRGQNIGRECGACARVQINGKYLCGRHDETKKEKIGNCKENQLKLCGREDCEICLKRSFASHERSRNWDHEKNNGIKPIEVRPNTKKRFFFNCDICNHSFDTVLTNISGKGSFCPYCANQKLCSDNQCKLCFERSFASHSTSKYWDYKKNILTPRDVFRS